MANVYPHLPMDQQIVNFANQRLYELKRERRACEAEMAMWEGILERMSVCKTCNGEKTIQRLSVEGIVDGEPSACSACKGTGKAS